MMKEFNEYNDKLISVETAQLAKKKGHDVYCVECFVQSDTGKDIDEYTGLIGEGYTFDCYRPTQSGL